MENRLDRDEARGQEDKGGDQREMLVTRTNAMLAREGRGTKAESDAHPFPP